MQKEETKGEKKKLETFLKPRREIIKKAINEASKVINDTEHPSDVNIPFTDISKITAVSKECEEFVYKKNGSTSDAEKAIKLYKAISSSKFIVLGRGKFTQRNVTENQSRASLDIEVGLISFSIPYANVVLTDIVVSGRVDQDNLVIETLESAETQKGAFFIPKEEFFFFVDRDVFYGAVRGFKGKQKDDIDSFQDFPLECKIYKME